MKKFPSTIHVVREEDGEDSYLVAHEDGVASIDEAGANVAIYQLVKVGKVLIVKSFKEIR